MSQFQTIIGALVIVTAAASFAGLVFCALASVWDDAVNLYRHYRRRNHE